MLGEGARLGYQGAQLSHASYRRLRRLHRGRARDVRQDVTLLRAVKDDAEIARPAAGGRRHRRGPARSSSARGLVGRAERDVAWDLQAEYHRLGAEGEAFGAIVAAGDHGAQAHALPGERVIRAGELVVIDTGARVDGYCSDITRTFAAGEPSERAARASTRSSSRRSSPVSRAVRAGAHGRGDVDAAARAVIDGGRLRRALRPRHRPRRRPRGPRGAVARPHARRPARGGHGLHRRAGHLRRGPGAACASRTPSWSPPSGGERLTMYPEGAPGRRRDVRRGRRRRTPVPARPGGLAVSWPTTVHTSPRDP